MLDQEMTYNGPHIWDQRDGNLKILYDAVICPII